MTKAYDKVVALAGRPEAIARRPEAIATRQRGVAAVAAGASLCPPARARFMIDVVHQPGTDRRQVRLTEPRS